MRTTGIFSQVAAVERDQSPGNPRRGVRGQEDGQTLDIIRLAQAADAISYYDEHEIVFAEAADRVGPKCDFHIAVAGDVQVGMVTVVLSDFSDLVEEIHPSHEVLHGPLFGDALTFVSQLPTVEFFELLLRLFQRARFDAAFTGLALSVREISHIGKRHTIHGPLAYRAQKKADPEGPARRRLRIESRGTSLKSYCGFAANEGAEST